METYLSIFIRLVIAHVLADFFLQPRSWVVYKWQNHVRDRHFWMHIGIVGLLTYLLMMEWDNWQLPLIIMITHALIDSIKLWVGKDNTAAFLIDQMAHLLVIVALWWWLLPPEKSAELLTLIGLPGNSFWLVLLGYLLNTMPMAVLIRYLTARWSDAMESPETGLRDAGKYIGIVERMLIFTFILFNELRAIGFLLAAKSVFRFGDLKDSQDRKKTEYILLGTLISFALSILSGLFLRKLI
jgi:hypothetical protein